MTPEVALLIRAVFISLLVLAAERFVSHGQIRRGEAERTVVKLPTTLNPVVKAVASRPLQISMEQASAKTSAPVTGHLKVVRLEPHATFVAEKQAA